MKNITNFFTRPQIIRSSPTGSYICYITPGEAIISYRTASDATPQEIQEKEAELQVVEKELGENIVELAKIDTQRTAEIAAGNANEMNTAQESFQFAQLIQENQEQIAEITRWLTT